MHGRPEMQGMTGYSYTDYISLVWGDSLPVLAG